MSHHHEPTNVPHDFVSQRHQGWQAFTKATVIGCCGMAALLLVMLIYFKIL